MNWKTRQRDWKGFLVMRGIRQKTFCEDNDIVESMFSNWVNGKVRASPENELKIENILNGILND